jgi:hypothetical protein
MDDEELSKSTAQKEGDLVQDSKEFLSGVEPIVKDSFS